MSRLNLQKISLEFDSSEIGEEFCSWLSNQGEQDFMNHMDMQGKSSSMDFQYRCEDESKERTDPERYGPWMAMVDENDIPLIKIKSSS